MCNVCVANEIIRATESRGGELIRYAGHGDIELRAEGRAEYTPTRYQMRRPGEPWPSGWEHTDDFAGDIGRLGLDVVWDSVPASTQAYIEKRTNSRPTV